MSNQVGEQRRFDGALYEWNGQYWTPSSVSVGSAVSLGEWAKRISALANRKGFRDGVANPTGIEALGTYTANLHGEVSELWEAARAGKLNALCDKADAMRAAGLPPLTCAEEELADIIIRALDTASTLGIDTDRAVRLKHAFNETRPHRHGGKLA